MELLPMLSVPSNKVRSMLEAFTHEILLGSIQEEALFVEVGNNEEVFFLHLIDAFSALLLGTNQGREKASVALSRAQKLLRWASPWEESLYKILLISYKRRYSHALSALERHLLEWPSDLFALKCVEFVFFLRGEFADTHWVQRIVERSFFSCQKNPYYQSLYAQVLHPTEAKSHPFALARTISYIARLAVSSTEGGNWEISYLDVSDLSLFLSPYCSGIFFFLLKKTGRNAKGAFTHFCRDVRDLTGEERTIWDKVGLPLIDGLLEGSLQCSEMYANPMLPRIGGGKLALRFFSTQLENKKGK